MSVGEQIAARLAKLNGWQRLWLLAAVSWFGVSAGITAWDFPTREKLEQRTFSSLYSVYAPLRNSADEQQAHCRNLISQSQYTALTTCFELANAASRNYTQMLNGSMQKYEERLWAELLEAQLIALGNGLALWLVPSIMLYVFGMAVGWGLKGFKQKPRA